MPAELFTEMVLIFALKVKLSSPNMAKGKPQADRLPILTANRRNTPRKMQKKGGRISPADSSIRKFIFQTSLH